jgi:hypothetical protein
MRIVLALAAGLAIVGCTHVSETPDELRMAALNRVHPNGQIPAIHGSAAADADSSRASGRAKLIASNDMDVIPMDDAASTVAKPKAASSADDAFDAPAPSAKAKSHAAKAKKTHKHH